MERLLHHRFSNGMLLLPYFRYNLSCELYSTDANSFHYNSKKVKRLDKYRSLLRNISRIPIKKKDIVFITSTLLNVKDRNGNYYNSLDGYYYDLYKNDSLIIENADANYKWRRTNKYECISYINTYIIEISNILAAIFSKFARNKRYKIIDDICLELSSNLFNPSSVQRIDIFVSIYSRIIRFILKRIKPKVIFCNCACYGSEIAIIMKVANDLGIRTIELQHGSIASNHLAYNINNRTILENEEYYQYLPKEIWLYGRYWMNNINLRIKKITVGNPHLDNYLLNTQLEKNEIYDYIIISQPDAQENIIDFLKKSYNFINDKKILIRTHPVESNTIYLENLQDFKAITYSDSTVNLYDDILLAKNVIGVHSTCLYEAIAFGKKIIIIDCQLSRKFFDRNIGVWCNSINDVSYKHNLIESHFIWEGNFAYNVKKNLFK